MKTTAKHRKTARGQGIVDISSQRQAMNTAQTHEPLGPTPQSLTHAHVEYQKPLRYERGEPVARLVGMHDRLVDADRITEPQWLWATRYVRETEILAGGREGKSDTERVDECSEPVYDRATAAAQFLRLAHKRMTPDQKALMISACVMAHRVADVAVVMRIYPDDDETMRGFTERVKRAVTNAVQTAIIVGSGISQEKQQINQIS